MTEDRKKELTLMSATLNGEPARVCRNRGDFAYIEQIHTGLGCQWSWRSAEAILQLGGSFRSC